MKDLLKLITDEDIEKLIHEKFSHEDGSPSIVVVSVQDIKKYLYKHAPILLLKYHLEELTVHQYAELCRAYDVMC